MIHPGTQAVLPALLIAAIGVGPAQEDRSQTLERVDPLPSNECAQDRVQRLLTGEFYGDEWVELLGIPDLDERETYYAVLLRRVRVDPRARAFLENLAQDPSRTDAAWTARLALRELGRPNFPLHNLFRIDAMGPDRAIKELFDELQVGPGLGLSYGLPGALSGGGASSSCRIEVSNGPEGARLEVVEGVDGSEECRSFEGESIEDILKEHPELEEELGIAIQGFGGQGRFSFQVGPRVGGAWRSLLDPLEYGEDARSWLEELLRQNPAGIPRSLVSPRSESRPVRTDKLGVRVDSVSPELAGKLGLEPGLGLYVLSTAPATLAYLFGVRRGHVLLKLNDRELKKREDIGVVMANRDPMTPLEVVWIDEFGQRRTRKWTPVKLAPRAPFKDR